MNVTSDFLDLLFVGTNYNDFILLQAEYLCAKKELPFSELESIRSKVKSDKVFNIPQSLIKGQHCISQESRKLNIVTNSARNMAECLGAEIETEASSNIGNTDFVKVILPPATLVTQSGQMDLFHKVVESALDTVLLDSSVESSTHSDAPGATTSSTETITSEHDPHNRFQARKWGQTAAVPTDDYICIDRFLLPPADSGSNSPVPCDSASEQDNGSSATQSVGISRNASTDSGFNDCPFSAAALERVAANMALTSESVEKPYW